MRLVESAGLMVLLRSTVNQINGRLDGGSDRTVTESRLYDKIRVSPCRPRQSRDRCDGSTCCGFMMRERRDKRVRAVKTTERWVFATALLLALAATPARLRAQSKADIDAGKQLFNGMCVECHGAGGAGGDAPSLNRTRLMHAPTDAALVKILTDGIPNTAMPRIRRFTDNEMRQLVAYVRSLGKVAEARVPGDAKKGGDVYRSLGCASCHIVNGVGGNLGPDLSDIGFLRGAAYLRQAVIDPGATLPKDVLQVPARGYVEYLPLRIVTKQGSEVRSIRVNEDAFTIQVRDQAGVFYSLRKSDLELLEKQTGKSLMPSLATRLTAPELTDLVAYLSSLRSAR